MTEEGRESEKMISLTKSIYKKGTYRNPWPDFKLPGPLTILQMAFRYTDHSQIPVKQELDKTLPIEKPDLDQLKQPDKESLQVTWIGHATVLVQMDGLNILTDPIFSLRCSPSQYFGPKRYRDVPLKISELPEIHAVVISHNHYDHLDYYSVRDLNARFGEKLCWYVPMGLRDWMTSMNCSQVIELDWWDEHKFSEESNIKFVFTPSQHWSKRTALDDNKALWGSWCVIGPWHRFFFAGDTGYCSVFKEIGNVFGPFDLSAIPIGAYEPRDIMRAQHVNPKEALQIHEDLKSKKSIGIHWGTFRLTYEFYLEPPQKLLKCLEEKQIPTDAFFTVNHGHTKVIGDSYCCVDK